MESSTPVTEEDYDTVRRCGSGGQYLLHRVVVERHALGSGRLHERQSGIAAFQRPDFRIVEQPFRIGLGLAGQCRHLRQPRTDEHKFNGINGQSVNSVKSVKPACLRLGRRVSPSLTP